MWRWLYAIVAGYIYAVGQATGWCLAVGGGIARCTAWDMKLVALVGVLGMSALVWALIRDAGG